jgi:preprotein translocase subunit SecA
MRHDSINAMVADSCPPGSYPEQWNIAALKEQAAEVLGIDLPLEQWLDEDGMDPETIEQRIAELADTRMSAKVSGPNADIWPQIEKSVLLERLDFYWKEHLATLDALRQVVFLRAYAQKTPINEYKQEAFSLFEKMLDTIRVDVTRILSTAELQFAQPQDFELPELPDFLASHVDPFAAGGDEFAMPGAQAMLGSMGGAGAGVAVAEADPYAGMGLSRNAPCPCGSGRKYKHCHGSAG